MKIMAVLLIGVLLTFNIAGAEIKFIPKEGKLWVKATGELVVLKSKETKDQYPALRLEDKNLYILTGELSGELKKIAGRKAEVNGLLRGGIEFDKKSIPSIEVRSVKEINK